MYLINNYKRLPITFEYGQGCYLYDQQGNEFLDLLSGISVCNLGHAHPRLSEVLAKQAKKLWHVSNLYHIEQQEKLAKTLCKRMQMQGAFFCNSGSEANETAIKTARIHAYHQNIKSPKIIVFENAFHGRTLTTLSASDNLKGKIGFEPLMPNFIQVPINDIEAIKLAAMEHEDIVAVLFEAVQGEGGIHILSSSFLKALEKIARQHNWLLIADEIQCGMCRTGDWFGYQKAKIKPDLVTIAKGLGNGLPIGACLFNQRSFDFLNPGQHGSTFGGNPLSCAVAAEVINIMEEENIIDHVNKLAKIAHDFFHSQMSDYNIRQRGLMIGIEDVSFDSSLVQKALDEYKILINVTKEKVIRLLPPLIIKPSSFINGLEAVQQLIRKK